LCAFIALESSPLKAQSTTNQAPAVQPVPEWQIAAGGTMAFDVASVKADKSGSEKRSSNILGFNAGPTFSPTGGLFSVTNYPLINYMIFAYKLPPNSFRLMQAGPDSDERSIRVVLI
jgi:hypothetical protein